MAVIDIIEYFLTQVHFRYVVFRPFMDEILVGRIRSCSREGVHSKYMLFNGRIENCGHFLYQIQSFLFTQLNYQNNHFRDQTIFPSSLDLVTCICNEENKKRLYCA